MKIVHIISIGVNGGENILQKYLNYIDIYKKFGLSYKLIVISPLSLKVDTICNNNVVFIQKQTTTQKCFLKRLWLQSMETLSQFLDREEYSHIILRLDFIDKNLLNFIEKYNPILEYPTPPLEKTLQGKDFYDKLAQKYNLQALMKSKFNITVIDVNYKNSYIFHNSLYDQHNEKNNFKIGNTINVLFMSSKYGLDEYNGYDRFLRGLEEYLKNNDDYQFKFYIAGNDKEGFESMLLPTIVQKVKIEYLGFKTIKELNQIIEDIDFGLNDLGFHRKGLSVANTLKTIDFLGWNLPFIVSHNDVNVKLDQKYFLKVDENDTAINIEDVISFLLNFNSAVAKQMREQKKSITLQKRVQDFISFLQER